MCPGTAAFLSPPCPSLPLVPSFLPHVLSGYFQRCHVGCYGMFKGKELVISGPKRWEREIMSTGNFNARPRDMYC